MQKNSKNTSIAIKIIWAILFLILAYLLWMEHRAHVLAYLPTILFIALLLLCPLMHLLMHHGHHHDDKKDHHEHHDSNK